MTTKNIAVKHVVVHLLTKEKTKAAQIKLSPNEKDITDASQRLIDAICDKYTKRVSKGYGCFESDQDNYPMGSIVESYFSNKEDFYSISCRMMNHLLEKVQGQNMATGGYVLFSDVNFDDHNYLLVAIVNATIGTNIADDFDILDSTYLDINKLRVAGRIDITSWKQDAERYISFLKGQNSVSNYFKQFLGCNDVIVASEETKKLNEALKDFAKEQDLNEDDKEKFLKNAHEYLKELNKKNEPINLEVFSNAVWPSDPDSLSLTLSGEKLGLSDGFVPDKKSIKDLVNFEGKTAYWELKFSREAFRNGIRFDRENEEIILSNLPPKLLRELLEEYSDE